MKEFFDKLRIWLFDLGGEDVEGIIGSADGPTAIVVAKRQGGPDIELFAFFLVLVLIVTLLIIRRKKK